MPNPQKPTHDYVATAPCGCVVGLIADIKGTEKDTAKEVADFIRRGCKVERVERGTKEFHCALSEFGHHCRPEQAQLFKTGESENAPKFPA